MSRQLPGTPEEYLTKSRAAAFRRDCLRAGVPAILYIDDGRYSGGEHGMVLRTNAIVHWMCEGLDALGWKAGRS